MLPLIGDLAPTQKIKPKKLGKTDYAETAAQASEKVQRESFSCRQAANNIKRLTPTCIKRCLSMV